MAVTMNSNVVARFSEADKDALRELATRLQRSRSDTLRVLVREAFQKIREQDEHARKTTKQKENGK